MSKAIFCQSCAMPMKNENDFGTEKNRTKSKEYCIYCYGNGEFLAPEITYEEMLAIGLSGIAQNSEMGRLQKKILLKTYPMILKKKKRWKK